MMTRRIGGRDDELAYRRRFDDRLAAVELRPQLLPPVVHPGRPVQPLDVVALDGYQNITSATFVTCWDTLMDRIVHEGFYVAIPWETETGTTGEVQGFLYSGLYTTSAVALPAASSGVLTFRWLHGQELWTSTDVSAGFQARRTGGSNNVRIGPPVTGLVQVDPRGCTTTGV